MRRHIWNSDIKNGLIGGLYAQLIWVTPAFIYSIYYSLSSNISFGQAFNSIFLWLSKDFKITLTPLVILLGILTILFIFIFVKAKRKNPIKWDFENFLGMSGSQIDGQMDWQIRSFQAKGLNRSGVALNSIEGHIIIDRSNEIFPIKLNRNGDVRSIEEMIALPPDETIRIVIFFDNKISAYPSFKGYEAYNFLEKFTPFTFVHIINGKVFKYHFSTEKVKGLIDSKSKRIIKKQSGPIFKEE